MLCLHVYLGWFLTGWLAPAPLKPSLALFLIHSLLACCCCSVSIEAHECKCRRIQWGFLIIVIIKMHHGAGEEFARVNASASGAYRPQYWDKWRRRPS